MSEKTRLQTIIDIVAASVREGITTMELEEQAVRLMSFYKVEPAFKGYLLQEAKSSYPFVSCISIDNEVIHGLPSNRKIEEGNVVKVDIGIIEDGQYDDGATTVLVGHCSAVARRLFKATQEALEAGIKAAKAGNTTHDIAKAIQAIAEREEFGVVEGYSGHGIGEKLHMEPSIPNRVEGEPIKLKSGMRICLEPMFSSKKGNGRVYTDANGWTVKLVNGGLAAHFEKSIMIE